MKLIMFKGGVETLEFFSMEMSEYFCEKGYEIFWYNLLLGASEEIRLRDFIEQNRHEKLIAITFNHEGIAGEEVLFLHLHLIKGYTKISRILFHKSILTSP